MAVCQAHYAGLTPADSGIEAMDAVYRRKQPPAGSPDDGED